MACVLWGQQCQAEVATLLIQTNVLSTTAQLHRTPAERKEGPEEGLGTMSRSLEECKDTEHKKKEDARKAYETKTGKI